MLYVLYIYIYMSYLYNMYSPNQPKCQAGVVSFNLAVLSAALTFQVCLNLGYPQYQSDELDRENDHKPWTFWVPDFSVHPRIPQNENL